MWIDRESDRASGQPGAITLAGITGDVADAPASAATALENSLTIKTLGE